MIRRSDVGANIELGRLVKDLYQWSRREAMVAVKIERVRSEIYFEN